MSKSQELTEKILKLREQGKTAEEVAVILNEDGDVTPHGLHFNAATVYNYISTYNRKHGKVALVPSAKKKPSMETIVAEEPRKKGKVIAIIADAEDVGEFLKGWVGNG